ncbi:MAG: dephospho-CoA kinase [Nannocystaceae bacterium]
MDVYGLTGGIGSGKSTVAELLEEYGVPVVSADELSRVVVAPGSEGLQAVIDKFGPEVVDDRGDLDRRRMASLVFGDPQRRRELEAILHPRIRDRFEQVLDALEKAGHEVAVYEVPLLFERNLQSEMKAVVLVTAPTDVRVARVRARDDVTETEVRARIAAQMDEDSKRRRADYIIENDGGLDDLRREVEFLLARFLRVGHTARRPGSPPGQQAGDIITGNTMPPTSAPPRPPPTMGDEQLPSRRPTAVPTDAPASISAPTEAREREALSGPPTVVETGPPPRATHDTVHPVVPASVPPPPPPTSEPIPAQDGVATKDDRVTRVDTGPPKS